MKAYKNGVHKDTFRDFFKKIEPIRFREPLAETLGAFGEEDGILEYTFIEVVKVAGHACPTTAGAYLCCQKALEKLYPDVTPVRGEISITVYGEQDEGGYGVIGQVFSFLTGAAPVSGFRGLGPKFRRKDLLKFVSEKIDAEAMCFEFRKIDTNKAVVVKFYPRKISFPREKAKRLNELLEKVIWEAAKKDEKKEFQNLWMEKVHNMFIDKKDMNNWLKVDERSD
ncbi:MAG: hypothetical protein GY801_48000 [bacterium]|nr:hypothetical protein [bacterium]